MKLNILVSNDDGVHAEGIKVLAKELTQIGQVKVVAPDRNCSGASNSLTLTNPLRIHHLDNGSISVNGTPTDCVHLAIRELYQSDPDIVISGINAGANLGDDTLYSGTVAAAMEGRFLGFPAIAVSLAGIGYHDKLQHYDTAAHFARKIIQGMQQFPLTSDQILNVNVPDLPISEIKGIKVTRLGARHRSEAMVKAQDPVGRDIFWLGPPGTKQDAGNGTDFDAVAQGFVSITPLTVDLTAYRQIEKLQDWITKI